MSTVNELRGELRARALPLSGLKAELVARLVEALQREQQERRALAEP